MTFLQGAAAAFVVICLVAGCGANRPRARGWRERSLPRALGLLLIHSTVTALVPRLQAVSSALLLGALYVLMLGRLRLLLSVRRSQATFARLSLHLCWAGLSILLVGTGVVLADSRVDQIAVAATSLLALAEVGTSERIGRFTTSHLSALLAVWVAGLVSLSMATGTAWKSCDTVTGKCTLLDGLLSAGLPSENLLAIVCALGCLVSIDAGLKRGRLRDRSNWLLPATFAVVVLLSGSRTPPIGLVVGVGVGLLIQFGAKRNTARGRLMGLGCVVVIAASGLLVVTRSTGSEFSFRGRLWSAAVNSVDLSAVFGQGEVGWLKAQAAGIIPDHYPHSEYLLVLYFGGALGLVVLVGLHYLVLTKTIRDPSASWARIALTPTVMVMGVTEVFWDPTGLDAGLFTLLAYLVASVPVSIQRPAQLVEASLQTRMSVG